MTEYSEGEIREAAKMAFIRDQIQFISTSDLIVLLTRDMAPNGHDLEILPERSDTYFSQKVRNLVRNLTSPLSLQSQGVANYNADREGWEVTNHGRGN